MALEMKLEASRREFVAILANVMANGSLNSSVTLSARNPELLAAFERWKSCYIGLYRACVAQQSAERNMIEQCGFPCVSLIIGDTLYGATTEDELDALLEEFPDEIDAIGMAWDQLRQQLSRWEIADVQHDHTRLLKEESRFRAEEGALARFILDCAATSPQEIATKLLVIIGHGELISPRDESPWPELRQLLDELLLVIGRTG